MKLTILCCGVSKPSAFRASLSTLSHSDILRRIASEHKYGYNEAAKNESEFLFAIQQYRSFRA
jgi:hypothetical protein